MTRDAARLRYRAGLSDLYNLAWPVILSRLGIMTMGLTDVIVVGRFSSTQLGYHAVAWAATNALLVAAIGLLNGVQVMTARHMGEGRPHLTGAVLRRGLVYGFWVGAAVALLLGLFGHALLVALGLGESLAAGATRPMQVFALSMPFYLMATAAGSYMEGLQKPGAAMAAVWIANLINIGVNLVLVPGGFGLYPLGAAGAAWATLISRVALLVMILAYIVVVMDARGLGLFDKPSDGPAAAVEQRRIGYAAGISYLLEGGAFSGMTVLAGWLGALQVAAWSVILNVTAMIFMFPLGLAAATAVLVSRAYGARDGQGVIQAGRLGLMVSAAISLLTIAVIWPGAGLIVRAYSADPALIPLAVGGLLIGCFYYLTDGLQVVAGQALRARGDVWLPTWMHLLSYGVIMLPAAWIFSQPLGLGVNGLVWGVVAASAMSGGMLVLRFERLARKVPPPEPAAA